MLCRVRIPFYTIQRACSPTPCGSLADVSGDRGEAGSSTACLQGPSCEGLEETLQAAPRQERRGQLNHPTLGQDN